MDFQRDIETGPDSRQDCLSRIEEALKITIPTSLKNILKINGFNNVAVLRNMSEKDIEEMEKFMVSDTAFDLIPEEEYEQFYGVFHRSPKKFKFLLGHKKLLLLISKFFQEEFHKENEKCNSEQTLTKSRNDTTSTSFDVTSKSTTVNDKDEDRDKKKTSNLAPNLSKENTHISQTIKNWIKNKCNNIEQWEYFKEKFSEISFETKLNTGSELCCTMTCFCKDKHQIKKSAQKVNYSERWVFGNFHRHLAKHFNLYQQSESRVEGTPTESTIGYNIKNQGVKKKQQQGMMKFITVLKPKSNTHSSLNLPYCERDTSETATEENVQELSIGENNYESRHKFSDDVIEAVAQDERSSSNISPKVNILSNQVVVQALVHSIPDNTVPFSNTHQIFSNNEKIEEKIKLNVDHKTSKDLNYDKNKWTSEKYQRKMRARRKRETEVVNQTVITSFFPLLSTVEKEVENIVGNVIQGNREGNETESVGARLNATIEALPQFNGENSASHRSQLLKMLINISLQNSSAPSSRYHYDEVVKKFSLYLFYIGGRLLYETLYENMKGVLPSISTLNNHVTKTGEKVQEGVFDYDGLCKFLEERNLPKVLWVSEDGTRVTGKVEYDSKSNKLVGFVLPLVHGLPQTDAFLATSAKVMQDYFLTSSKSNYAYLVMTQPLSKSAPSYCLAIFGTNNKFDSNDVTQRWKHIKENLESRGMILLGFSSDGDTRLLKAMRQNALLPTPPTNNKTYDWEWFQAGYKKNDLSEVSYVQDTVHIATKLRTRFLNPKANLTIGSFTASSKHLEQLIANFSKEKHLLTLSDLKGEDKMCFKSAEKMCSESVIQLLENIPGSEGTRTYLRLMQFAIASYSDPALDIKERLYKIWFCVFFLRIWRKWIANHQSLKIADSFVTSNCYICVELNAHALINICTNFRDNPTLTNDMFLPHLFNSQTCEKTFRATRSMTTTYSTVINYSIKDIIRRLDRIKTINNIMNDLQDILIFPREKRSVEGEVTMPDLKNLSDECIQTTVEQALHDVLQISESLGMQVPEKSWNCVSIALPTLTVEDEVEDEEVDDITFDSEENSDVVENDSCEIFKMLPSTEPSTQCQDENQDPLADPQSEVHIDMCNLRVAGIGQELLLKDFSLKLMSEERDTAYEKGPLVRVTIAPEKSTVIKKSSLCWLLSETTQRVSTDRLRRFFNSKSETKSKTSRRGSVELKRKILPKSRTIAKKKLCTRNTSQRSSQRSAPRSALNSDSSDESSDEDQISVKYADSTDTETFSDGTDRSENRSMTLYQDCSTTNTISTTTVGTSVETFTSHPILEDSLQPECGKFYAIYYEQRWYLGLITKVVDDECIVKFLRKKRKSEREFLWPKVDDICKVSKEFIFYGPIKPETSPETSPETDSGEVPLCLSDLQLRQIDDTYAHMKKTVLQCS